jgi:hypothetical protein
MPIAAAHMVALALSGHARRAERCPFVDEERKTWIQPEYFAL